MKLSHCTMNTAGFTLRWNFLEGDTKSRRWGGRPQKTSSPTASTTPHTSRGPWPNPWWFLYPRTRHHNKPTPIRCDLPGIISQNAVISFPWLLLPRTHKQHRGSERQHSFFTHVTLLICFPPAMIC